MAEITVKPALAASVFNMATGLQVVAKDSVFSEKDILIRPNILTLPSRFNDEDLKKFRRHLERNGNVLSLSADHLQKPPTAPLTAEDIRKQLSDPNSPAYKLMIAMIQVYILMVLDLEICIRQIREAFTEKMLFEQMLLESEMERSYRRALPDAGRPAKQDEAATHSAFEINCLCLTAKITQQKSQDFLFLSRFATTPEEIEIVKESVERRYETRLGFIEKIVEKFRTANSPRQQELLLEQFDRMERSAELSTVMIQTKVLGDIITDLMDPRDKDGKPIPTSKGSNLGNICKRFEVSDLAANQAFLKTFEKLVRAEKNPPVIPHAPTKAEMAEKKIVDQHGVAAFSIHKQITNLLLDVDKKIQDALDKLESGDNLSERDQKYLAMLTNIPKQQEAIGTILRITDELAHGEVEDIVELTKELNTAIQTMRKPFADGESSEIISSIEELCGEELNLLQSRLNAHVGKKGDVQNTNPVEKKQTDSDARNGAGFFNEPKASSPKPDEVKTVWQAKQKEALDKAGEEEEDVLGRVDGNEKAITKSLLNLRKIGVDDEIQDLNTALESLRDNYANPSDRHQNIDEIRNILKNLDNTISDKDVVNEITDYVLSIPCIAKAGKDLDLSPEITPKNP